MTRMQKQDAIESRDEEPFELEVRVHPFSVEVLSDHLTVRYSSVGALSNAVGNCVRANRPIPIHADVFYFEVYVIDAGLRGEISVGFCRKEFELSRQPGMETYSYGYRGSDGRIFSCGSKAGALGQTFTSHDVVGCGLNFLTNEIFYTKNGSFLKVAFTDVDVREELFPVVSLHSDGESATINFGAKPFRFDLHHFCAMEHRKRDDVISSYDVDASSLLPLIKSYLIKGAHLDTLQQLNTLVPTKDQNKKQSLGTDREDEAALETLSVRNEIRFCVLRGEIDRVSTLLSTAFPMLLESNLDIQCRLALLRFISIVREQERTDEAIRYAQETLRPFANLGAETSTLLQNTMALLVYPEPHSSPVGYLLDQSFRQQVASFINAAILQSVGSTANSGLERLIRTLMTVEEVLQEKRIRLGQPFSLV